MKHKKLITVLLVGIFFSVLAGLALTQQMVGSPQTLELKVKSFKQSYKQGELVDLSFTLTNQSSKEITVADCFGTATGNLEVLIAKNGEPFLTYNHPNWGTADMDCRKVLPSNKKFTAAARILWNWKPELEGLNSEVARTAAEGKILTDYVFPEAGAYLIKISYYAYTGDQPEPVRLESEPVQIIIEEPVGEDAEVWEKIRGRGDIGYFIQESEMRAFNPLEKERLRQEIAEIFSRHSTSPLAKQIGRSLETFDAREAKRKAFQQKLRQSD